MSFILVDAVFIEAHVCSDVLPGGSQYKIGCEPVIITVPGGASQSGNQVSMTIYVENRQTPYSPATSCGNPWSGTLGSVRIASVTPTSSCSGCFSMNNPGTKNIAINTQESFPVVVTISSSAPAGTYTLRFTVASSAFSVNRVIDIGGIEVESSCSNECSSQQCSGTGYQTCSDTDGDGCTELSSSVTACADAVCKIPSCSGAGVCSLSNVASGLTDTGCSGSIGCSGGSCKCDGAGSCTSQPLCTPECSSQQCSGTGYQTCSDTDGDGCTELGPVIACPDTICREPSCSDGSCTFNLIPYGSTDTGCSGSIGCSGGSCKCNGAGSCTSQPLCTPGCTTDGSMRCSGNSYQTCSDANSDGCLEWSPLVACPSNTPYCTGSGTCVQCTLPSNCNDNNACTADVCTSNVCGHPPVTDGTVCSTGHCCSGVCDTTVDNEDYFSGCRAGPSCVGTSWEYTVSNNGNLCGGFNCRECSGGYCIHDDSSRCSGTQACSAGNCSSTCASVCSTGQKKCVGSGYQSCADTNSDGCLEWGEVIACTDNKCSEPSCNAGICTQVAVANNVSDEACHGSTGCTGGNCGCNGQGSCISFTCTTCTNSACGTTKALCAEDAVRACTTPDGKSGFQYCHSDCSAWDDCVASPQVKNTTNKNISNTSNVLANCNPTWTCTDWSSCAESNERTRECTDQNKCNTQLGKPSVTESCEYQIKDSDAENTGSIDSTKAQGNSASASGSSYPESKDINVSDTDTTHQSVIVYMKNISPTIIAIFIVALLLTGGLTYMLIIRKSENSVKTVQTNDMTRTIAVNHRDVSLRQDDTLTDAELKIYDYLKFYLDKNFTPEQLKQGLVSEGKNPSDIDKILGILLHNYVKFCLDKNFTAEQLKQFLIFEGWNPEQIDEKLKEIQSKP